MVSVKLLILSYFTAVSACVYAVKTSRAGHCREESHGCVAQKGYNLELFISFRLVSTRYYFSKQFFFNKDFSLAFNSFL